MATYYINGTTLSNSTSIFTDADLTICAADGFYSDGTITRELTSCVLGAIAPCPSCSTFCNNTVNASGSQGVYLLDIDTGTLANSVGAVKITFAPAAIPDGIRATFDGVVYNELSSPVDGYHASTTPGNFTYVGRTSSDCGISGTIYPSLPEFNYVDGAFVATGNAVSETVDPGDVSLSVASPGLCVMVIPKLTPSPNTISFEFVGPCVSTAWSIIVDCPVLLTEYNSSTSPAVDSVTACGNAVDTVYYNMPVTGTPGAPELFDWVFEDAYGQTVLGDGFFKIDGSIFIEVQNGIIVDKASC